MRDRYDEFRKQAEFCQHMARTASLDSDKEAWLRMAQSWLAMLPRSAEQTFDDDAQDRGTGQDVSKEQQ